MLNLSEYRKRPALLADWLPWAGLVAPGIVLWIVGHSLAVWGARLDPQFMAVFARHIKHKPLLDA